MRDKGQGLDTRDGHRHHAPRNLQLMNSKSHAVPEAGLDTTDRQTLRCLLELDQDHLFSHWPAQGALEDKHRQLEQLRQLDAQLPAGLRGYIENAKTLLAASRSGANPYAGLTPSVPHGRELLAGSAAFLAAEAEGVQAAKRAAFVLVAGGLGERLGYSGIKIALPAETLTRRSFLELYAQQILALEQLSLAREEGRRLPLAIMTSDDTDAQTRTLLREHDYFGLSEDQVTLIKQEKVPSLLDAQAHLAKSASDPYVIATKPHGHGDVHLLLHQSGLAQRWSQHGVQHILFFQDTNPLWCNALIATLGVSVQEDLDMNTMAVPRRAGEAAGALVRLEGPNTALTINVEYNQLDPLLRATVNPEGDVADASGHSPYPGNTNAFVLKVDSYLAALESSGGKIAEFVNPKYADDSKTTFKSPTRLECMMQDFPKVFPSNAHVGFTNFAREQCFSAAKNSLADALAKQQAGLPPEGAGSVEADLYSFYRSQLQTAGANIEEHAPLQMGGLKIQLLPIVVLDPSFAVTQAEVNEKVKHLHMTANSSLYIAGPNVRIESLSLHGALRIEAVPGAHVRIAGLHVENEGPLVSEAGESANEVIAMRGFALHEGNVRVLRFDTPGNYLVDA